jgi:hypothetical protein
LSFARVKPDTHAAILGALRLNSNRSEHQRRGDGVKRGLADGDADHCGAQRQMLHLWNNPVLIAFSNQGPLQRVK